MDRLDRLSKLVFTLGILFFMILGGVLGILTYSQYQAYVLMRVNVAGLVQIVNYNLQQGRLTPVPPSEILPGPPGGAPSGAAPAAGAQKPGS